MRSIKNIFVLEIILFTLLILNLDHLYAKAEDPVVKVTLLHLNDVYEITPVSGGKQGGLARVATLRKELLKKNPNTYTILAGDLFSPSALGTAPFEDGRLNGRQIVDVMNKMGLDYATFGNHEFDLKKDAFYARLKESKFKWFSSNVFDAEGKPFPNVSDTVVINAGNGKNVEISIGLIGVTLESNPKPYVLYQDPIKIMKSKASELKDKVDVLIAVTHLAFDQDIELATEVQELDMILGGHEHENIQAWRGTDFTPVFKADANARTVYVHDLSYDTVTGKLDIESRLEFITDQIADDIETAELVKQWTDKGYEGFRNEGFEPEKIVAVTNEVLDGRESTVRNKPTRLTELIAAAMVNVSPKTDLALFNGGSIRIDDVLPAGKVTEYDVIRIMPFGGDVLTVQMNGEMLQRILDQGVKNRGTGGYLQTENVTGDIGAWMVNKEPLASRRSYLVAINDFLMTGKESRLGFLTRDNKKLKVISENGDIRKALISQMKETYKCEVLP